MADKQANKHIPALRFPEFIDDGEWEEDSVENFIFQTILYHGRN